MPPPATLRSSLFAKVLLGLVALGVLCVAGYASFRLLTLPESALPLERQHAELVSQTMRHALDSLVESHPRDFTEGGRLEKLLGNLMQTEGTQAAAVYDASGGALLASAGGVDILAGCDPDLPKKALAGPLELAAVSEDGAGLLLATVLRRPMNTPGSAEPYGVLVLRRDFKSSLAERRTQIYRDIAVLAGAMSLVGLVVLLGLRTLVLAPACRLAEQAAALGSGDLSARSGLGPATPEGDEVERLAASFDAMADRLEAAALSQASLNRELRESEARSRAVFEHASIAISQGDPAGRILDANPACLTLWGYAQEELAGKRWIDLTHPDDREESMARVRELLAGKIDSFALKKRYVQKGGGVVWASVYVGCVRGAGGQAERLILVAEDITAQKTAEAAQAEREELYQAMFEKSRGIMLLVDPEAMCVVEANQAAQGFYGYTREEFRGLAISRLNPLPQERVRGYIALAREAGGVFNVPHRLKSGELRSVEVRVGPFRSGGAGGRDLLLSTIQDITDRVRAETALGESRERFRALVEAMAEGVVLTGVDETVTYANPTFARYFGVEPPALLGLSYAGLLDAQASSLHALRMEARRKGSREAYEARFARADGTSFLGRVMPFPLFGPQGEFQGSCGIITDITEQRAQEEGFRMRRVRRRALLELHQMRSATHKDVLDFALKQALELCASPVGYLFAYDDVRRQFILHAWSAGVSEACRVLDQQNVYSLDRTGLWGDAVRLREPVMLNDFSAPDPRKKGLPEGHVPVSRFLTLPVIRAGRVVAVVGVANKEEPYTEEDVQQLRMFTEGVWSVLERLEAEQDLREVTERFQLAVRAGRIGLWDWDLAAGVLHCDPMMEELFGLEDANRTGTPEDWLCRVHPEERKAVRQALEAARGQGARFEASFRVPLPGGAVRHIEAHAVTYRDAQDQPLRMVGANIDVTPLREAESRLTQSHQLLQTLIDTLPHSFFCKNAQGRFLLVNKAFAELRGGGEPESFLGRTIGEVEKPEAAALHEEWDRRVLETGPGVVMSYEMTGQTPDGWTEHRIVYKSLVSLPDGSLGIVGLNMDNTRRKLAEEDLARSEERHRATANMLRLMCDNVSDMIWAKDLEGRYLFANKALCVQVLGARDTDEPIGRTDLFFALREREAHLEDPEWHTFGELCQQTDDVVLGSGQPGQFDEDGNVRGQYLYLDVRKAPFVNDKGLVIGTVGSARNITERRAMEDRLRESEERFRTMAEASPVCIFRLNLQGECTYVSASWMRTLGYEEAEILGMGWVRVLPEEDRERVLPLVFDALSRGEPYEDHGRLLAQDGRTVWVLSRMAPERDAQGRLAGCLGSLTDITELRRAQEALQQHQDRMAAQLALAEMHQESEDQIARFALSKAQDITASALGFLCAVDEPLGLVRDFVWSGEATASCAMQAPCVKLPLDMAGVWAQAVRQGRPVILNNYAAPEDGKGPLPEGHPRVFRVLLVPTLLDGQVVGLAALGNKVGDYTRADEEHVALLMEGLWAHLRHRRAEDGLLRAKAQAEAATQAKAAFLANMSHEIRTPLSGVIGTTRLLTQTRLTGDQRQLAEMAMESGRALLGIVNDILDFSKIEAGKLTLRSEPFSLRGSLESVAAPFRVLAVQRGLAFTLNVEEALPDGLKGDEGRLGQVLRNLLSNALKFTEQGGIHLEVALDEAAAEPFESAGPGGPAEATLRFTVADTGPGIPQEYLLRLFESFSQADASYAKQHGGTGLGLAICKSLVEQMGGSIGAESAPGQGSVFSFSARFTREDTARRLRKPAREHPAFGPLKLLLAEDNEIGRTLMERVLADAGHTVACAVDGEEALRMLAGGEYDLVLMDVQMPRLDGLEATRRIRAGQAGEQNAGIPIVALTAYVMREDRERFAAAGMDDYVGKPVEDAELFAAMGRALSKTKRLRPPEEPLRPRPELAPRFDLPHLERSFAGRGDLLAMMLEQFVARSLPEIREGLAGAPGDLALGRTVAHKAKGTFGTMGALRAARLAEDADRAARAGKPQDFAAALAALTAEMDALEEHIRAGRPWPDNEGAEDGGEPQA